MYQPDIILYHADCRDGFGALVAVLMAFPDKLMQHAPVTYGKLLPPLDYRGKKVLFVDFCPQPDEIDQLSALTESIVIIDHHKTAAETCKDLMPFSAGDHDELISALNHDSVVACFDMTRSGAGLAWAHYHAKPLPMMLAYVQDRDLWKWELPKSKEFNTYLSALPMVLDVWWERIAAFELDTTYGKSEFDICVDIGTMLLAQEEKLVRQMIDSTIRFFTLCDDTGRTYIVPGVNASCLQSEIGNRLALDYEIGIGLIYYEGPSGFKCSLRSRKGIDITPILKRYGGGGHASAGGFMIDEKTDPIFSR